MRVKKFIGCMTQRKMLDATVMDTELKRCLTTFDITLLGIGHMVGSGIYVLSAEVAKDIAGPAIVISYLITGIASFLSALSYAEFGVCYPRAGSAYSYTYLALGEATAFLVGWNVVLENVIGLAAVTKSCSSYINRLTDNWIVNNTIASTGRISVPYLDTHFDFLAVGILLLFLIILSLGAKITSMVNNIFTFVNIAVTITFVCIGAYFADVKNWTSLPSGFFPYGWKGVVSAAATCFYSYVGFDAIATSAEEAKNPQRSLPIATFFAMAWATLAYVSVSAVLTLMVPYYDITGDTGLPDALAAKGAYWATYVITAGALCGMSTVTIATLFALARIVYAMAEDGLIFKFFHIVSRRTQIPIVAMWFFAFLSGVLAFIIDMKTLVEMLSIGTLTAYLFVSASVIVARYQPTDALVADPFAGLSALTHNSPDADTSLSEVRQKKFWLSGPQVTACLMVQIALLLVGFGFMQIWPSQLDSGEIWIIIVLSLIFLAAIVCVVLIGLQTQNCIPRKYKMPWVPILPSISIALDAYLMTNLQGATWIRLVVWVAIGFLIYFSYGMWHSSLRKASSTTTTMSDGNWVCRSSTSVKYAEETSGNGLSPPKSPYKRM